MPGNVQGTYTDVASPNWIQDNQGDWYLDELFAITGASGFDTSVSVSFLGCGPSVAATGAFTTTTSPNGQDTTFSTTLTGTQSAGAAVRFNFSNYGSCRVVFGQVTQVASNNA